MKDLTFFDQKGTPKAYSEDRETIYSFSGTPLGYLTDTNLYHFDGTHLGWFDSGWIRDHKGNCLLFTDEAAGGPYLPYNGYLPYKGYKNYLPYKGYKAYAPYRAVDSSSWSEISFDHFFKID